jgi:uncharacterized RDD family membrane protein YckC
MDRRAATRDGPPPAWDGLRPVPLDWEMAPPAEAAPGAARVPPRRASRPRPRPAGPPAPEFDVEMEVGAVEVHRERAPAWRRLASWAVDGVLLGALLAIMLLPAVGPLVGPGGFAPPRGVLPLVGMAVALAAFAYEWLGVALAGATPGLLGAGLRVVGPDGRRPSPGRAAARSVLALAAAAPFGAGLLLALFTRSGQGAHDLLARTWVVMAAHKGRHA